MRDRKSTFKQIVTLKDENIVNGGVQQQTDKFELPSINVAYKPGDMFESVDYIVNSDQEMTIWRLGSIQNSKVIHFVL